MSLLSIENLDHDVRLGLWKMDEVCEDDFLCIKGMADVIPDIVSNYRSASRRHEKLCIYALLFAFGHFGFSGLMGAFYGAAKTLQQKEHGKRAGFMLVFSFILPVLAHGACAALIVYGIEKEKVLWLVIGLLAQTALAVLMAMTLSNASDAGADDFNRNEDRKVDFGDSEEFAGFAEASGSGDSPDKPDFADTDEKPEDPQESDAAGPADDDGNTAGAESGKSSADDF